MRLTGWRIFREQQSESRNVAQGCGHSCMRSRIAALILGERGIMFSAHFAPDKVADRVGQTLARHARHDFADDRSVAAGVSPFFSGRAFAFDRAKEREKITVTRGFGQLGSGSRLPAERRLQLKLFVSRIAIRVNARLGAFHSRTHIDQIAQRCAGPITAFEFRQIIFDPL